MAELDSLNLYWPHSVNYHLDEARPDASSLIGDCHAQPSDTTRSQKPVATYNGVPRECVRNAQPLVGNEIRVLDLKGGTRGTPLLGSLRRVPLSDYDGYEPLSYTWEDHDTVQPSDEDIEDDVHPALFLLDTDRYLNITWNCARALCSIRKPATDRAIWVDSICVNQDDPEERSHQVDLMKAIYARAFTVLVYLGRESSGMDSSSSTAMELLRQPDRLKQSDGLNQHEITSLKQLFERRYFRRMWIVQEVALAQTLEFHCGPDQSYVSKFAGKPLEAILGCKVTPPWLRHSKQTLKELPKQPPKKLSKSKLNKLGIHHMGSEAEQIMRSQAEQILRLVFDTALCDCTDDRDRVFALLGLLDNSGEERLRADYNLSTAQVCSGLAAYLATNGFLWGVLMLAPRLALNSCSGLPSWVPDWNNLGKSGLYPRNPLMHIVLRSRTFGLDTVVGIASSGVITIRGMLLGSVTNAAFSDDHEFRYDAMDADQRSTTKIFTDEREHDDPSQRHEHTSIWKLEKPSHNESLDSWGCHFKFYTRCKQAGNAHHRVFMLPDYSTLLILKPHGSFHDQHTLVEIGMPLIRAELPNDWNVYPGVLPHIYLRCLKPMTDQQRSHWDTVLGSKEVFPRLADFPQLWSYNPFTSTMSLTHEAIEGIQRVNIALPSLLETWREHVHVGMQMLRDRTRLRQLIDEVKSLGYEEFDQREKAAGLPGMSSMPEWSTADFLGLFIRDPHVQLHDHQPLDEIDKLETVALELRELELKVLETDPLLQLLQWTRVSYQVLELLSEDIYSGLHGAGLLMDEDLCSDAQAVARSQVSCELLSRDRTSFLLEKIFCQLPGEANPELEEGERPRSGNKLYWDWTRFNSIMEQRSSFLSHIKPDVEKIKEDMHDLKPDFGVITGRQVFAAHGFNPRKEELTQIQIR